MKYIPLDYTASNLYALGIWTAVIGTLFGLVLVGVGIHLLRRRKNKNSGAAIPLFIGVLLIALSLTPQVVRHNPNSGLAYAARSAQLPEIQASIEDRYGFKPTRSQVSRLDYPRAKPTKSFEIFGSFEDRKQTEGANFETRKVYLVWADGKLNLSQSTDGESFTELKSKD